jgi:FAD/FMN-containing dehydrogenase
VFEQLRAAMPELTVLTDPTSMAGFTSDWTGHWSSSPLAVVQPTTTEQVGEILQWASAHAIHVITQGGNTGLVGGSVGGSSPHIILSTKNLRSYAAIDHQRRTLTASAGFTLGEIQEMARSEQFDYPVDIAARDSATIGGTVATNAGGIRVIAHGMTSAHVVGLEVVLSDGTIIDAVDKLPKDNTGPDWLRLFIGSEGTLGVITAVSVQLSEQRNPLWTALIPVTSIDQAIEMGLSLAPAVLAAEIISTASANEVATVAQLTPLGTDTRWWLLLEADCDFESAMERIEFPEETILAQQPSDVERLWTYRERHTEMISRHNNVVKLDVSVPLSQLNSFIFEVSKLVPKYAPTADCLYAFGHVLDGNIHISVRDVTDEKGLTEAVLNLVVECDGAISAEHGIGRMKTQYWAEHQSASQLTVWRGIRKSLDRAGVMNPEVLA